MKTIGLMLLFCSFSLANSDRNDKFVNRLQPKSSSVSGIFSAPSGTTIVLQVNGGDDLTVTAQGAGDEPYGQSAFGFPKPLADGANYKVTIKSAPPGLTCSVYANGEGAAPNPNLRVSCDYSAVHLSHSRDGKNLGIFVDTYSPAVGGIKENEGRYVVFVSYAAGLGGASGKYRQIIRLDRNTGEDKLISASPTGEEGNQNSLSPVISADGKTIAFESYATNLAGDDGNGARDVYVWRESTGKVELVSKTPDGIPGNAQSWEPAMSATGAVIAFTSNASNLAAGAKGTSTANVFVKDMNTNKLRILSLDPKSKSGVGGSNPSVSYSGEFIAFYSFASTLVDKDENNLWDIFIWDSSNPKLKKLNFHPTGADKEQGNDSSSRVVAPSISGNGKFVAFATTANNLVQSDGNRSQDVFVVDIANNKTTRVSQFADGTEGDGDSPIRQGEKIAISYDGQWVAFSTASKNLGGNVLLRNWVTNETRIISSAIGATVGEPSISAFGNYVVFGTSQRLDAKYQSSGIFGIYTGLSGCRFCPQ